MCKWNHLLHHLGDLGWFKAKVCVYKMNEMLSTEDDTVQVQVDNNNNNLKVKQKKKVVSLDPWPL